MTPKALFERLIYGGISAQASPAEVRCIALVNVMASVALSVTLLSWIWTRANPSSHVINLMSALFICAVIGLNRNGRHTLAAVCLSALTTLAASAGAITGGLDAGTQYYVLLVSIFPFFVFPPDKTRLAVCLAALCMLAFITLILASSSLSALRQGSPNQRLYTITATGVTVGTMIVGYYARHLATAAERRLVLEHEQTEALLKNVFPAAIAARLKDAKGAIADSHEEVTVIVADIADFTKLSEMMSPEKLVSLLNEIFSAFDELCERYSIEKIRTIGDAYIAASGLPQPRLEHAAVMADLALEMRELVASFNARSPAPIKMRIGIASGRVVAGVIGKKTFSYDVWGEALDAAMQMQAEGLAGEIQIADTTRARLGEQYHCEPREGNAILQGARSAYLLKQKRQ